MNRFSRILRRSAIALVVLAVLVTALITAVAQFDLNTYRPELEQQLSELLGQPVRIGRVHLAVHGGLALDVDRIEIERPQSRFHLTAPLLYVQLHIRPLLWGDLNFSRIRLIRPTLTHRSEPGSPAAAAEGGPTAVDLTDILDGLSTFAAEEVEVAQGTLIVDKPGRPPLSFENLNLRLAHWTDQTDGELSLYGSVRQQEAVTRFQGEGTLPRLALLEDWRTAPVQFQAHVTDLQLKNSQGQPPCSAPCTLDTLELTLQGTPQQGLQLQLAAQLRQTPATAPTVPIQMAGQWRSTPREEQFEELKIAVADSEIGGRFRWVRGEQPRLQGLLTSPYFNLGWLKSLIPTALFARFDGGHLKDFSMAVDSPWPLTATGGLTGIQKLQGNLQLPRVNLRDDLSLTNVAAHFSTENGKVRLSKGDATLLGQRIRFSGVLADLETKAPAFSARATGVLNLGRLSQRLKNSPKRLKLTGTTPFSLNLSGRGAAWTGRLESDLTPAGVDFGNLLAKVRGRSGVAVLTATSDRHFSLALNINPLVWQLEGRLAGPEDQQALAVTSSPLNLSHLQPLSPLLRKMKPRGLISGDLVLSLGNDGPILEDANLALQDVGIHLNNVVADFDQLTGRIAIHNNQLTLPPLQARWGGDPVTLQGRIADMRNPVAELKVRAKRLKADSLIFASPTAVLQNLDGRLLAGADGITLAPVNVTLKGGTRATVTGTITNFSYPKTDLHVDARYGNIDEVIDLFVDPDAKPTDKGSPPNYAPVTVTVEAQKGHFSDLRFTKARATVTNRDRLVIVEPLHLTASRGTVEGRVLYDYSGKGIPRLDISGHVEKVDADRIYRKFFREKGLVTGKLTGDFFLTGHGVGDTFLKTTDGHFHLTIRKGVLRKFKALAKVFSFLNVSQVFKGNLWPDMDKEGMPFNKTEGSFTLKKGVLRTENLRIDSESMNLSMVGDLNLRNETVDMILGVKPLVTVDRVVTRIPLMGWLLTGEDKALVMAHYQIRGPQKNPSVTPVPGTSLSKKVLGIFERVLTLPGKVVTDPGRVLVGPDVEGQEEGEQRDAPIQNDH